MLYILFIGIATVDDRRVKVGKWKIERT